MAAALATRDGVRRIELALRLLARDGGVRRSASASGGSAAQPRPPAAAQPARTDTAVVTKPTFALRESERVESFRVLIAEDEADILELYRMVLTDEDSQPSGLHYAITMTRTAGDCLEVLRAAAASGARIDLLVMDLGIGDMRRGTGEGTLLVQLRAQPDLLPRRILVVSGISSYLLARREDDLAALGAAFLPKPFNIDTLAAAVAWLCMPGSPQMDGLRYFP